MVERRFSGRAASSGLAIGPLTWIGARTGSAPSVATSAAGSAPDIQEARLRQAITRARSDLEALAAVASGDGAEILEFQIEMLADEALIEDTLAGIGGGRDALAAWQFGLQPQIDAYQQADDAYFRARASDLEDLKDRVSRVLSGVTDQTMNLPEGAILLDDDLTPSRFLALDWTRLGGAALLRGSAASHVAMLARSRAVPLVVAIGTAIEPDEAGGAVVDAVLDAEKGVLIVAPSTSTRRRCQDRLARTRNRQEALVTAATHSKPATTKDGQRIELLVNVDHPDAIDDRTLQAADGVGLMRTEFLFIGRSDLPDEEEQYRTYLGLVERLPSKPAIIRTLDIGGDKPLAAIGPIEETNPFLGLRGIRYCLEHREIFRPQVRALLRVAATCPIRVMLPMVTVQAEIDEAIGIFDACLADLRKEGIAAALPSIGVMVETPAAAIAIDRLAADFYSIGSNDLIQYVMAASRDAGGRVSDLLDPAHPAIARLIEQVVDHGRSSGREVSLCGDMASDPALLPVLLRSGLRKISVAPAALDRVKLAIAELDLGSIS